MRKKSRLFLAAVMLSTTMGSGFAATNISQSWSTNTTISTGVGEYNFNNIPGTASYSWDLINGAQVISSTGDRLFLGSSMGAAGVNSIQTLNVGSSNGTGGTIFITGTTWAGARIGHSNGGTTAGGILNIDNGVTMQMGNFVFGDATAGVASQINVKSGALEIYATHANNLSSIDLTLGAGGSLWLQGQTIATAASFFASSGKTLTLASGLSATDYRFEYTDLSKTSIATGATERPGLLVTVVPINPIPEPSSALFCSLSGALILLRRKRK